MRRDSAVKLIDGLAGESPASAGYPVGTVVISGDGAGDQTVGSPDVNVLDGWTLVWSAPKFRSCQVWQFRGTKFQFLLICRRKCLLRGVDLNHRPLGYEGNGGR